MNNLAIEIVEMIMEVAGVEWEEIFVVENDFSKNEVAYFNKKAKGMVHYNTGIYMKSEFNDIVFGNARIRKIKNSKEVIAEIEKNYKNGLPLNVPFWQVIELLKGE